MSRAFTVETSRTGHKRRVRVLVYDTIEEMQKAASRYCPEHDNFENALACSQPCFSRFVHEDGRETDSWSAGCVRFVKGEMGATVLSHEMVHMGLAIYRNDFPRAPLGNMKNEEVLCHIVSDLVRSATSKFWDAGYYS